MADRDTHVPLLVHRADSTVHINGSNTVNGRPRNGLSVSTSHDSQLNSRRGSSGGRSCHRRLLSLSTVLLLLLSCFALLAAFQLFNGSLFCESGLSDRSANAAAAAVDMPPNAALWSRGQSTRQFSEYDCLAGHSTPGVEGIRDVTTHSRMCWFRNVCMNRQRELFYYSDPSLPAEPIRVDTAIHTSFPSRLVNLRRYLPGGALGQALYTVQLEREAIPATAVWSTAAVHALYHQFWPENFGHVLGDDVYPVYQQLRRFGLLGATRDVQVLGWLPCSYSGQDDSSRQRACDNTMNLFSTLSDRPWQHLDDFFDSHHNRSTAETDESALVCLDQVVMGHGLNGMYWQGRDWPLFIEHINHQLPADTQATRPHKLSILITRKTNRRKVVNFDELVTYLHHTFDVDVDVWEPNQLPFDEQVRRVRQYSVLVTPCGGISFVSPFLYPGSSAVYVDWLDVRWNATSPMEEYVWQHDPRLTRFHYHIRHDDIRGIDYEAMRRDGVSRAETDEKRQWRNYPLLYIEPARMAYFVMHALRRAASRLGLTDTLNYTRIMQATDNFSQLELEYTQADTHAAGGAAEDDAEAAARKEEATVDTASETAVEQVAQLVRATNKASHGAPRCGTPVYQWSPGKGRENFGDVLGVVLIRLMTRFDPRVRFTTQQNTTPKLTSIGSIADTTSGADWVWSSGVHPVAYAAVVEQRDEARKFPQRYGAIHVAAMRGPRSRRFMLEATNSSLNVPEVYGDGALLLPLYFSKLREQAVAEQSQNTSLTGLVSIIPHLRDYEAVRRKLAAESQSGIWRGLNYQLVWVLDPWESVLRAIVRSSLVISSSLHGVIIAESFGIGARVFRTKASDGAFKYSDYYEGTSRFGVNLTHTLDEAVRLGPEVGIGGVELRRIQRGLLESFPKQLWDDCSTPPVLFNLPVPS